MVVFLNSKIYLHYMDFFAHLFLSIFVGTLFPPVNTLFFVLGGVILDIDHLLGYFYSYKKKKFNDWEKQLNWFLKMAYYPRTFFHSMWGALILTAVIGIIAPQGVYWFFAGLVFHLTLDSLDKIGIKWFWPYGHIKGTLPVGYLPSENKKNFKKFHTFSFILSVISIILIILI